MYVTQEIANRIKRHSKARGIPLKDLLTACEININAISEFSKGKKLSCISLALIADKLNCSVDYLLGRTDVPEVNTKKEPSFDSSRHSIAARGTPVSNERFDTLVSQEDTFERSND